MLLRICLDDLIVQNSTHILIINHVYKNTPKCGRPGNICNVAVSSVVNWCKQTFCDSWLFSGLLEFEVTSEQNASSRSYCNNLV